ncbi:MAG: NHLP bacteriocin export ABC transporter permease/ATPase subunit [Candidatus Margulisiibacteriota bacterium]
MKPLSVNASTPLFLDDSEAAFKILEGYVDVFSMTSEGSERLFIATFTKGMWFFACPDQQSRRLVAIPGQGTHLETGPWDTQDETLVEGLETWAINLQKNSGISALQAQDVLISVPGSVGVEPQQVVRTFKDVVWLVNPKGGTCSTHGIGAGFPLTPFIELQFSESQTLEAVSTKDCLSSGLLGKALLAQHRFTLACDAVNAELVALDAHTRMAERETTKSRLLQEATLVLDSLGSETLWEEKKHGDPLVRAVAFLATVMNEPFNFEEHGHASHTHHLKNIGITSGLRFRNIRFNPNHLGKSNLPILAYTKDHHPVVIYDQNGLKLYDPTHHHHTAITHESLATLSTEGVVLYRSFPQRALARWEALVFCFQGKQVLLGQLLGVSLILVLMGFFVPIITGYLFDYIIPYSNRPLIVHAGIILLTVAVATACFQVVRGFVLIRLSRMVDLDLHHALWSRLLELPTPFFRQYSVGDLEQRVNGVAEIRGLLSSTMLNSIVTALFSLFNLGLLFVFSPPLACVALGLMVLLLGGGLFLVKRQVDLYAKQLTIQGQLSGFVYQLITGVAKLRVAGAQVRAFSVWASRYVTQKRLGSKVGKNNIQFQVLMTAFPLLVTCAVFFVASDQDGLTSGRFLAFYSALGQLVSANMMMLSVLVGAVKIGPLLQRIKPILVTSPEVTEAKVIPAELNGKIEVNQVSFAYPGMPQLLKEVSFLAEAGQFIAIVGPSGSGKSTMLRLLLGFDSPQFGSLYFDDQDMADLNLKLLRQNFGVVLQNSRLIAGDIFTNIVGSSPYTLEDAWEAAKLAGIDQDIHQLPMGMHTVIMEGGSTFSGGQRQRLMLARALIHRPKILFLDEATSAMDNVVQAIVRDNLAQLNMTRIVVAHRLSTIVDADRILVMNKGQIVESGTYSELMAQRGLFFSLASRQL